MHRVLDVDRAVRGDAAVVAGQQHRPLGQRHEDRLVDLELHRQVDLAVARVVADASTSFCSGRRMRSASDSNRADLKLVGRVTSRKLIFSPGGRIACGSGLHRVSCRARNCPTRWRRYSRRAAVHRQAGDARQIRQRRHVHDRHARHLRLGARVEQLAHAGRAVLRLLHRQHHEVVVGRVDVAGAGRLEAAGQLAQLRSTGVARPRIGMRTWAPSELNTSTSLGRQTIVILWPPNSSLIASSEPYEAPIIRML